MLKKLALRVVWLTRCTRSYFSDVLSFLESWLYFYKNKDNRFAFEFGDINPQTADRTSQTHFDKHYVYHTSWAARCLRKLAPKEHTDIGSCIRFSSMVSAFVRINFYDYRPPNLDLEGLNCRQADLLKLPFDDNSIFSLSCMHVVEHVGLGRYGDKLDVKGDIKACRELTRVLGPNGFLIFVVPLAGKSKIAFNAHRIYTFEMVLELFKDLKLVEFALISDNDRDGLIASPDEKKLEEQSYGCGCFLFKKEVFV